MTDEELDAAALHRRMMRVRLADAMRERDALRAELEQVKAERDALSTRFAWRHAVERDTSEAIAAWLERLTFKQPVESAAWLAWLGDEIRSGRWRAAQGVV